MHKVKTRKLLQTPVVNLGRQLLMKDNDDNITWVILRN